MYTASRNKNDKRDAANILYTSVIESLLGSLMGASLVTFAFPDSDTRIIKYTWFGLMLFVLGCRAIDAFVWKLKSEHLAFDGNAAIKRFIVGSIATAVLWSLYCLLMFSYMETIEFAATLMIVFALAGGAASVLSSLKNTASLFIVITLLPISLLAILSGFEFQQLLGILGLLYCIMMAISARKTAGFTEETIHLKNENAALVTQMQLEKSEVDKVHLQLSQAYVQLNEAKDSLEEEVQRRTEKISQLSNIDPLTGLYNRSAFTAQLRDLIRRCKASSQGMSLLFIDLNGFKKVNDTLGHKVGDGVLVEIAKRLDDFTNDYHAGRWGGDEFLIALPYADKEAALSVSKALQTRISQPVEVLSNELHLGASIGIAVFPEHTEDELELIQLADLAMFEQKKLGNPSPLLFSQALFASLKRKQQLRDGLQQAIDKKELYLCYQPIMCCQTGRPMHLEALLRWNFDGQPVRPDIFIPLAEQSGLIKDIGSWVLSRSCIDASQWQFNQALGLSVNVSVIQLIDDSFLHTLDKALKTSRLDPQRLHLEITESIFVDNKDKVLSQLDAIKARKVNVSIDDFGTGYSSLSQLQTLNFDTVKIDKSFVHNLDKGGEAIIRATLSIAKEFGCHTIAEGIETAQQMDRLKEMGTDCVQGFLFAKPMPNDTLSQWLLTYTTESRTALKA